MLKKKTPKQLERHLKGVANHRRIEILLLVAERGGITMEEISEALTCNFKTISMHTQKLVQAGLLNKKYVGRQVAHDLSPYGITLSRFIKSF
jgi:predicted transcriptional regulator